MKYYRYNPNEDECEYCEEGDSDEKGIVYEYSDPPFYRSNFLHRDCVDPYLDEKADYEQGLEFRYNPQVFCICKKCYEMVDEAGEFCVLCEEAGCSDWGECKAKEAYGEDGYF